MSVLHFLPALDAPPLCDAEGPFYASLEASRVTCHKCLRQMAPQVSEKALQLAIRRLAVRDNWLVHCTTDSRRSPPGYPDLTLLKPTGGLMLVLELKTDTGIVTLEQARWLDALGRVTRVHAQVVRPGDLAVVHALLAGHAP